ncbi:MAG: hypothetical protein ACI85I_000490 [Arenicella sp.]|jgi:uncharacterized protein (TIRG00374 family)
MAIDSKSTKVLSALKPSKIILPIAVGLGVTAYLIVLDDSIKWDEVWTSVSNANLLWVFMAFFALVARDAGYVYRIRNLTNKELTWTGSIYVILLWEFASALTPSVVGGTAVVMFIINKEGIPFGKSLAYVMLTAVLDNLFFVCASIFVIFSGINAFPELNLNMAGWDAKLPVETIFIVSATLIATYTGLMIFGLFVKPQALKWLFVKATYNRFLKKFRKTAIRNGDDIILASQMLKGMTAKYWAKAILSTTFIWSARYLIVNFLIAAFTNTSFTEHVIIFARSVVMWIVMLLSPTPGSAGVADIFFPEFYTEFTNTAGLAVVVGLCWRLLTYYLYLILGVIALPKWVGRVFGQKTADKTIETEQK